MVVLTLTLGLLLVLMVLTRGRDGLLRLAALQFRASLLPLAACLAQALGVLHPAYREPMMILSAISLALFCVCNWHYPGMLLMMSSMILNMTVILANHGAMPMSTAVLARVHGTAAVSGESMTLSKDKVLDDDHVQLAWLDDRLVLPGPLCHLAAWSWGDVVLVIGVARLLWARTPVAPRQRLARSHPSTHWRDRRLTK